jgi:hypothetical protein
MHTLRHYALCSLLAAPALVPAQYSESWHVVLPADAVTGEDLILYPSGEVTVCGTRSFTARYDAQGNTIWQNTALLNDPIASCVELFPAAEGGTVAVGDYENGTGTNDLIAFHQDAAGMLLGTSIVNSPGTNTGDDYHAAAQDSAGNIYLTGAFVLNTNTVPGLAKLNSSGDLQWQVVLPLPSGWSFGQGYGVACANDTVVFVLVRNAAGSALLRYSAEGVLLGCTDLDVQVEHRALGVDPAGNAVIGGSHGNAFNVTKVMTNGAVQWSQDLSWPGLSFLSGYISDIECDGQGNVYAAGSAGDVQHGIVAKLSSTGSTLWMDTTEGYLPVQGYLVRHRDRLLLNGDRLTLATAYAVAHLYEYDTTGERLLRQALEVAGSTDPRVNAMRKAADGTLYLTGYFSSGLVPHGYLAKMAAQGPTGIAEMSDPTPVPYPVPCQDQLRLAGIPDGTAVDVIDGNGRTALHRTVRNGMLQVSDLTDGLYVLHLPSGNVRFLKQRR